MLPTASTSSPVASTSGSMPTLGADVEGKFRYTDLPEVPHPTSHMVMMTGPGETLYFPIIV